MPAPRLALRPGDRAALVAPSSPFPEDDFARGLAWYRARLAVDDDPRVHARTGYLSGPDGDRAATLLDALGAPSVRALLAARGGYGATRVLERAGDAVFEALRRDPKPVVGFSDATALHALWARAGVRSVHGAMVGALGRGEGHPDALWRVLTGEAPAAWEGLRALCGGQRSGGRGHAVTGRALGGNLALVAALAGTPWQLDLGGAVLLLEDVREPPYRVDRMLTTLRLAGALRGVAAVVLGAFTRCDAAPGGAPVEDVLRERFEDLGVPVLWGAPFGHGAENLPWVSGAPVTVDAARGTVVHREGLDGA